MRLLVHCQHGVCYPRGHVGQRSPQSSACHSTAAALQISHPCRDAREGESESFSSPKPRTADAPRPACLYSGAAAGAPPPETTTGMEGPKLSTLPRWVRTWVDALGFSSERVSPRSKRGQGSAEFEQVCRVAGGLVSIVRAILMGNQKGPQLAACNTRASSGDLCNHCMTCLGGRGGVWPGDLTSDLHSCSG